MPEKPNILLVHGAWGDASHWRHIIPRLHEKGYTVFAVQNPLTSLSDDINRTSRLAAAQEVPTLLVGQDKYGFLWIAPEKFRETFCDDLDETESLVWALTQKPTAARCFEEQSGAPAWKVRPSWYQISTNDRLIPPETEKWMAERMNARRTITLQTSHASVATHPDEIVDLIEEASHAVMTEANQAS
jgi:pimeloyl-ACP methyl ester carboxylesterase